MPDVIAGPFIVSRVWGLQDVLGLLAHALELGL
jgi:hypothetical protein